MSKQDIHFKAPPFWVLTSCNFGLSTRPRLGIQGLDQGRTAVRPKNELVRILSQSVKQTQVHKLWETPTTGCSQIEEKTLTLN